MTSKISRRLKAALDSSSTAVPDRCPTIPGLSFEHTAGSPRRGRLDQIRKELSRLRPTHPTAPFAPAPARPPSPSPDYLRPYLDQPQRPQYQHCFSPDSYLGLELMRAEAVLIDQIQHVLTLERAWTAGIRPLGIEELLFFDIETTGLSRSAGTLAFVIGVGAFNTSGELVVNQFFLSDPGRETDALQQLEQHLSRARVLVSFNGRSFDLPVLRNRGLLNRLRLNLDLPHLDLLHLYRRLFRSRLTDCRLTTIEKEILHFYRQGDPGGAEAPRMYHDYLNTGCWDELPHLLHHNLLDVVVLSTLLRYVCQHLGDPLRWVEDPEELLAIGQLHLRQGCWAQGESCLVRGLELARVPHSRQRLLCALARHLRRIGRRAEAATLWYDFRRDFPEQSTGWVELAKYHEHVTRDIPRALALAERTPLPHLDEHQRRLHRLRKRIDRELSGGAHG